MNDITERKKAEEVVEKRLTLLTRSLDDGEIAFDELFKMEEIQRIQDEFSAATGVASLITHIDGTPYTQPSNFTALCSEIIRKNELGCANCIKSDIAVGRYSPGGPSLQPCLSGGLWDAGVNIVVGGHHVANWLIGQVRDPSQSGEGMRAYAQAIGADEAAVMTAFESVPVMSRERFEAIAKALFTLANQLSDAAFQNIQQARFISERKQAEEEINRLAFSDQLTGLPNRTLLQDRLKQAMAGSLRSGRYGALLLIDLDYFKILNDTLGHDMGDLLLRKIARRLTDCVREEDTVARFGGDEFVVMLLNLSESQREAASQVELIGEKIGAALNHPYQLKKISYRISPSIGATVFLGYRTDVDTLLKQADLAMYKAKDAGRNALRFFDPEMARDVLKRAALENDLREALQKKQFEVHYQPQLTGSKVTGAEVLLRWRHPERGLVAPGAFISVLEETGLILAVGQWVLQVACEQLADWAARPEFSHLTVAVNISARQFNREDFANQILLTLDRSGADPQRLKLELTESLLVNNVEDIIGKMTALKAKGVGFSLDDFGTGYSSLAYLKRLPLDQLKIDQSFVRDILTDPNDAAIARMIVVLADSLGLAVIAEGVETEAQRDSLLQHGCHAYQGYFVSRPLPRDEFESFMKRLS